MANLTQELIAEQANAPITAAIAASADAGIDATAHPDPANPRAALMRYTTRLNRSSFEVPFPYLDRAHLFAWGLVDGDWLEMTPRFIGPQTVYLPVTFDMEQVVIYRHTPRVVPTPPDGTPVTAEGLNRILLHSRYVIEEIGGALAARPSYCRMLPPGPPEITLFDVAVIGGVEAVVTWEVTGETDTLTLNGVPVAADGVQSFPITEDTEFTLFAENVRGSDTSVLTAEYTKPPTVARFWGIRLHPNAPNPAYNGLGLVVFTTTPGGARESALNLVNGPGYNDPWNEPATALLGHTIPTGNSWLSHFSLEAGGSYLRGYEYNVPTQIVEARISASLFGEHTQYMTPVFDIVASADGVTWETVLAVSGPNWTLGETRIYTI